jgi:hypothetical protein
MFLRCKVRRKDGKQHRYWSVVENTRVGGGRAGRAFIDVEGLVLYPIFDQHARRLAQWETLIQDIGTREMESGLFRLVVSLLQRINAKLGRPSVHQLQEYVLNNAQA